jgi:predicted nucleic acid-binding protein
MSVFVVDASVAMKWFVPEVHTADALRLRDPAYTLHAPGLFDAEMSNIAWKKVQRAELAPADAADLVAELPNLPLSRHPILPLLASAFDLACQTRRTVYDCLYLALALQLGQPMVTADQRLVNALASTPHAALLRWIANVP